MMTRICMYEAMGRRCTAERHSPESIFCLKHKDEPRYIILYDFQGQDTLSVENAEKSERILRLKGYQANLYQYRTVMIGPTTVPLHTIVSLLALGCKSFESHRYEDSLEHVYKALGLINVNDEFILHPMILYCPKCGFKHVDTLEDSGIDWARKPHHKHLCHACGSLWTPYTFNTVGVEALPQWEE